MTTEPPINKKLCIIGDGATGKTCILFRFVNNKFNENQAYEPTIFENENITCAFDGEKINLSLWDTAGQEDFKRIRILAYDSTDILLVTFSLVERASFENVKDVWHKEVEENKTKFKKAKILLIGTKADLKNGLDENGQPIETVSQTEAENMAKEINAICYIETSSKTGDGIKKVFDEAIKAAMTTKEKKGFCLII